MSLITISDRKKRVFMFAGFLLALLALMVVAFVVLNNNASRADKTVEARVEGKDFSIQQQRLLQSQEVLNKRLMQLQTQDGLYTQLARLKVNPKKLDSMHNQVLMAELALQQTLDSLDQERGEYRDNRIAEMFNNTRGAFRSVLSSRRSANSMRMLALTDSSMFSDKELALLEMQNKLIEKESRIVDLEMLVKTQDKLPVAQEALVANRTTSNSNDMENINNNLKTINNTLRRENEQLKTQIAQFSGMPDANTIRNRYAILERKSEDLKADLSFAQVDCNLIRVDASHIISNSRQRKDLLEEALKILNALSTSTDPEIKKRAKEKTAQLNKLVNTVRD